MPTNVRNILLEVVGKADDAQRSLLSLAESVRELPDHKTLEVEAEVRKAQAEIREMLATLKQIDRTKATPEVKVAITKATLALEKMDEELDALDGRRVEAHLEVQAQRDTIDRALAAVRADLARFEAEGAPTVKLDAKIDDAQRNVERLRRDVEDVPATVAVEFEARERELVEALQRARQEADRLGEGTGIKKLDAQIAQAEARLEAAQRKLAAFRHLPGFDPTKLQEFTTAVNVASTRVEELTAKRREAVIKLDVQIADAQANIARIEAELAALPEQRDIALELRSDQLRRELAAAVASVETLTSQRHTVVTDFEAKTAAAEAEVAALTAQIAALPDTKEIDVRVNQAIIGDLGRMNAGLAETTGRLGRLTEQGQRFGQEMSSATFRASVGFLSFGGAMGPLFAIIAGLTVVIGVSLVGAIAALIASFAAAAAGAAAMGAAIIAALGPIIGLAIAVATRIAKVFEALKAQDAAAEQIGQKAVQGSTAAAAAAERQAVAAQGLQDAQERLRQATVQAYREMEDAAEAYSDAVRGIADAELGLDSARLSIREAEAALQDYVDTLDGVAHLSDDFKKFTDVAFDFDTGALAGALKGVSFGGDDAESSALRLERLILNVREARQGEKRAVDAVSDAERNRSRTLATHNAFVRDGIAASQGYQAALRGVRDAQRQVNQAVEDPAMLAAQAKAIVLVGELTEKEKQLLAAIKQVRNELRGAFRGATDAVFGGMIRALQRVPRFINPLRGAFTRLGRDIAASLDIFSKELIRPEWTAAIRRFIEAGGRIARVFTGRILVPFLRIVRELALAALPHFERLLRRAGNAMTRLARSATGSRMADFVDTIVEHLESWLALVHQLARVFINFIRAGASEGRSFVDWMTDGARKLADFMATTRGKNRVREFLEDAVEATKTFIKNVVALTAVLVEFANNVTPGLTKVFSIINDILGVLDKFGLNQGSLFFFVDQIKKMRDTSGPDAAAAALDRLADAEDRLRDSHLDLDDAQRGLTDALREGRRELRDMEAAASGAKLSTRRARLDVRDAKARLAALKAEGASADEIERANIDLADARLRLSEAVRDEKRALDDNKRAQAAGVKGTDVYKSAAERLQDSMKESTDALREFVEAQREAANPPQQDLSPWDRLRDKALDVRSRILGALGGMWDRLTGGAGGAMSNLRGVIGRAVGGIPGVIVQRGPELFRAAVSWAGNIASGIRDRAASIRQTVGTLITGAIAKVKEYATDAYNAGKGLGQDIADGIGDGFRGLKELGREIVNGLIDLMNDGIRLINKATPGALKIKGRTIIPAIPDIDAIPHLASGGMTTGSTAAVIGDNPGGREAVLPLTRRIMRQLAHAITSQMSSFAFTPALATAGAGRLPSAATGPGGRGGVVIENFNAKIDAPAGSYPDARTTMTNLERLVDRVGGDPNI